MKVISGIAYNYKGLKMGLKTPVLLFWGLVRFFVIVILTVVSASLILNYHNEILGFLWGKPESNWIVWLWYVVSWLLTLLLMGLSAVISFLIAQILFSVMIMDTMSRITEQRVTGKEKMAKHMSWFKYFFYLLRQEIPRAVIPVIIILILMVLGWLTPLSPVTTMISALAAGVFLAWDNTDLIPARRHESFGDRFGFLLKNLGFHLGFGLWFLIPVLNILFLSFAPVGATLYYIERIDAETPQ
ncbi:MAG: EI24 domain-containing protein [Deltaproteobacteria bacterium]|jgi:CysZ protein|nr:EI24 domain-containing protein [Deltaproteobacteria bacterium]MBW2489976.1 EI24 domain-containing protein [Deltaproteobacteria bacterium]